MSDPTWRGCRNCEGTIRRRDAGGADEYPHLGGGAGLPHTARTDMAVAFNRISRGFGVFFEEWDVLLDPDLDADHAPHRREGLVTLNDTDTPHEWFAQAVGHVCLYAAGQSVRHPRISIPVGAA